MKRSRVRQGGGGENADGGGGGAGLKVRHKMCLMVGVYWGLLGGALGRQWQRRIMDHKKKNCLFKMRPYCMLFMQFMHYLLLFPCYL